MSEIKVVRKKDIPKILDCKKIWQSDFLPISKHRLLAHYKNPNSDDNDVVLLLAYLEEELVGYMGVYIDKIQIKETEEKIGWLSTWWMHPKSKGLGLGRGLLQKMYELNSGKIGISQFTPSAKRVYDKSNYFLTLKKMKGIKGVFRSNLSNTMPLIWSKSSSFSKIFSFFDWSINIFVDIKLLIQKELIKLSLKDIQVEYLNYLDEESSQFINENNNNHISKKNLNFLNG